MNVLYSKLFSCKVGKKVSVSCINVPIDYLEQVMICFSYLGSSCSKLSMKGDREVLLVALEALL